MAFGKDVSKAVLHGNARVVPHVISSRRMVPLVRRQAVVSRKQGLVGRLAKGKVEKCQKKGLGWNGNNRGDGGESHFSFLFIFCMGKAKLVVVVVLVVVGSSGSNSGACTRAVVAGGIPLLRARLAYPFQ